MHATFMFNVPNIFILLLFNQKFHGRWRNEEQIAMKKKFYKRDSLNTKSKISRNEKQLFDRQQFAYFQLSSLVLLFDFIPYFFLFHAIFCEVRNTAESKARSSLMAFVRRERWEIMQKISLTSSYRYEMRWALYSRTVGRCCLSCGLPRGKSSTIFNSTTFIIVFMRWERNERHQKVLQFVC